MLIIDEEKYAEDCIENGVIDNKPYYTLRILAKYWDYKGFSKDEIQKKLTDFFVETAPDKYILKKVKWDKTIEKVTKKANGNDLIVVDSVPVTQKELDVIAALNDKRLERLLFTMLVLAKFNHIVNPKNDGWVNYDEKTVFDTANLRCSVKDRPKMLCELYVKNLIEYPKKQTKLNERITFMDEEGEPVLNITDLRKLGMEYQNYKGEGLFKRCEECGIIYKISKNSRFRPKQYCNDCAKKKKSKNTIIARKRKSF